MPNNIHMQANLFTQTSFIAGSKTMAALKVNLLKEFNKGKIKIRVTKLKKDSLIYLGAIEEAYFNTLNFASPHWNTHGKMFYINNKGSSYGHINSFIKAFSEGSNI